MIWTFFLNFSLFIVYSLCRFHLIFNWLLILIVMIIEVRMLYHTTVLESFFLSLLGCMLGLALNIFFRSFYALVLRIPLSMFDNNSIAAENMKIYPVISGFLFSGFCFWMTNRTNSAKHINMILKDHRNLLFIVSLLSAMYLYLSLNLIVYYLGGVLTIVKLWSMKSSIFVIIGECLAIVLSYKMAVINSYREDSKRAVQALEQKKLQEQRLRTLAVMDPLTGCANQSEAMRCLENAFSTGISFLLVFIDLNCLKEVNDKYGHEMGDYYLQAVSGLLRKYAQKSEQVYRYGGDEFIIIIKDCDKEQILARLQLVQNALCEISEDLPFLMSISYGIACSQMAADVKTLIQNADQAMYHMKQKMKKERMA